MQRTAQDWLVLTQLTHGNAAAVGIVMALQFGPQALLLPLNGFAADHFDRRKLLLGTQAAMGALALGLGILTVAGIVRCGMCMPLHFCWAASRRSIRQRAIRSSRNWLGKRICQTLWH